MHANASFSSQTAEMLAILLNSLLPDDTLTAAKLELIRIVESRQLPSNSQIFVSSDEIMDLFGALTIIEKEIIREHDSLVQVIRAPQGLCGTRQARKRGGTILYMTTTLYIARSCDKGRGLWGEIDVRESRPSLEEQT
jgi:hypothetical protein